MRSLGTCANVRDGKFIFYVWTRNGIDNVEKGTIEEMNIEGVLRLIDELQKFVEGVRKNVKFNIGEVEYTLTEAMEIRKLLDEKLRKYGV